MPNSYKEYDTPGTGANGLGQTTFSVPFKFININDINAKGFDGTSWTTLTISSRGTDSVTLSAIPSTYTAVRIYRATSSDQLVDFQAGARLSESDLDTAYQQGLYAAQEVIEDASLTQFNAVRDASIVSGTTLANFASQAFTATSNQTEFNITTFTPQTVSAEAYRVSIDGAMQSPTDAYTISMSPAKMTLTSAAPTGSKVVIVTAASAASATAVDDTTIEVVTATNKIQVKDSGVTNAKLAGSISNDKLDNINLTNKVTGVLPVANGGTGSASYFRPKFVTCTEATNQGTTGGSDGAANAASRELSNPTGDTTFTYNLADFRSDDSDFNADGTTLGYKKIIGIYVSGFVATKKNITFISGTVPGDTLRTFVKCRASSDSTSGSPQHESHSFAYFPVNDGQTTFQLKHFRNTDNSGFRGSLSTNHVIVGFDILPNLPVS